MMAGRSTRRRRGRRHAPRITSTLSGSTRPPIVRLARRRGGHWRTTSAARREPWRSQPYGGGPHRALPSLPSRSACLPRLHRRERPGRVRARLARPALMPLLARVACCVRARPAARSASWVAAVAPLPRASSTCTASAAPARPTRHTPGVRRRAHSPAPCASPSTASRHCRPSSRGRQLSTRCARVSRVVQRLRIVNFGQARRTTSCGRIWAPTPSA